jgi:phage terminase large subunit GpA-like protein
VNISQAIAQGLSVFRVPPPMLLSTWADEYFYLSEESSYDQGRWRTLPPQRAILDCMGDDEIEEVNIRKSARVGYTKMLTACVLYNAQHRRRNQAIWQPTDDDAEHWVRAELDPVIRDCPIMRDVFPGFLSRDRRNTLHTKIFLGSMLHIRGGKAAGNYRRLTVDNVYMDELDGFDTDIESEGAPDKLARKRLEGSFFRKMITGSTPKIRGMSRTDERANASQMSFRFYVPCPHCDHYHTVEWGGEDQKNGMKFDFDAAKKKIESGIPLEAADIRQLCPECGSLYGHEDYLRVWDRGEYRTEDARVRIAAGNEFIDTHSGATCAKPRSVNFDLWTGYLDRVTWHELLREFVLAETKRKTGDDSTYKTFVNTTLGMSYEEQADKTDVVALKERREQYQLRTIPREILIPTAAVDVQDNRFEIVVVGWGPKEESWILDYTVLSADPADEKYWQRLGDYLFGTKFSTPDGKEIGIEATAIDTAGHFTHQAYAFARDHVRKRVYATKGATRYAGPIKGKPSRVDVNYRGKIIPRGVALWNIGTDTAKDLLHGRLRLKVPGPGYVHFSDDLEDDFFMQLVSERRVRQRTARGYEFRWAHIDRSVRNEVLDCMVMNTFLAQALDIGRYTPAMWERKRARLENKKEKEMAQENESYGEKEQGPAIIAKKVEQPRMNHVPLGSGYSPMRWR